MVDYIIVGGGYAGLFFAHQLIKDNKSFVLFDVETNSASRVSAGIVNPVVLKKFTSFWLASEQISTLRETLGEMEVYLNSQLWIDESVHRIFHDENEKSTWLRKADENGLKNFLSDDFKFFEDLKNPFGCGEVLQSGRIDVRNFFSSFKDYLQNLGSLRIADFNYKDLKIDLSEYQGLKFRKIVFCEGMGVRNNPFFSFIPVQPNKGHQLNVKIPGFENKQTLKKKHFLFPLSDTLFYYGGTYDRHSKEEGVDDAAVAQLENGLSQITDLPYDIDDVRIGFRPTVADRRPVLGQHPQYGNCYVFNGLGSRGILNGSYFSRILYEHIEYGAELPPEVDLKRFL